MNQELTIYKFKAHDARLLVDEKNEPWFVANDVGAALGLKDTSTSVNFLDKDERHTVPLMDLLGRKQEMSIISEAGLYTLILKSRKPEAKEFKDVSIVNTGLDFRPAKNSSGGFVHKSKLLFGWLSHFLASSCRNYKGTFEIAQ